MSFLRIVLLIESLAAFAVVGVSCSRSTQVAGWGSETTNGMTAAICRKDGTPAAGAVVRVRKNDFVTQPPGNLAKSSIYGADALTDAQGRFEIRGIDPGSYTIEVSDSGVAVLLACSIEVDDTVNFHIDTLRSLASVRGSIDTSGMHGKRIFVQVCGLERIVSVDSAGAFSLNDLPAGLFSLHIIAVEGTQTTTVRTDQVSAISGDTVSVIMPGWSFSRKVYLNTTSSGAAISGDVRDFPVLVRLTHANFDFSQAKSDGGDIRFSKADTTTLPYEIERWDAPNSQAEIWVRIDTVHGNDSSQFITMYWGASVGSASNGNAVFDTARGFEGVWHFGQAGNTVAYDATLNHFDQTPFNMTAGSAVSGEIGTAQRFDGQSSYFQATGTASGVLNFPKNGTYAISAWAYTDTVDRRYHTIACKGDYQYNLEIIPSNEWEFAEYADAAGWEMTTSHATEKVWTYVTGIRNGSNEYLYVNGALAASTISLGPGTASRNAGFDFFIGRTIKTSGDTTAYFFKGILDEVRISSVAPSADWVKLSYMNQKADDALVVFK